MKNLKVSMKLIVSFLIVIALTLAVGVVGIVGMIQLEQAGTYMYTEEVEPLPYISRVNENIQSVRVYVREMIIGVVENDRAAIDAAFVSIESYVGVINSDLDEFESRIVNDEIRQYFNSGRTAFEQDLVPVVLGIHEASLANNMPRILELLEDCRVFAALIIADFERCMELKVADAAASNVASSQLGDMLLVIIIVALVLAVALALVMAFYISGLLSKPINSIATFMHHAATTGDITLSDEHKKDIEERSKLKSEIGELYRSTAEFVMEINTEMEMLTRVAEGDLSIVPNVLSDNDVVGNALTKTVDNLNNMFSEVKTATDQVASGSRQVADGSQSLAQGSTEQAASVQQLSSSIIEIAEKTRSNADMAEKAAMLANDIKGSAEKGSQQMDEMMTAVKDINISSQNISKVIKSIDDIAFQTNILALNAAVEAARAGQHGKGFAVVAEEVRNLAAKSAEAAKDTESLIADSIEKAELGSRIADETAASLAEIVAGIGESSALVSEIAKSSEEQSVGIDQINKGIDQVAQVTQQNSATAEESAAASQEMSGQSMMLEELISRFKLKNDKGLTRQSLPKASSVPTEGLTPEAEPVLAHDGNFGKY